MTCQQYPYYFNHSLEFKLLFSTHDRIDEILVELEVAISSKSLFFLLMGIAL